ncbi:MAG: CHAT domain-containing protein [Planctomycetaceae bacterium]
MRVRPVRFSMGAPGPHPLRLLALFALASAVAAQEPGADEAASEVLASLADASALAEIAARAEPDPWLVAGHLLSHGESAAAAAFAAAAAVQGADTAALGGYVAARGSGRGNAAVREALAAEVAPDVAVPLLEGVRGRGDGFEQALVEEQIALALAAHERFAESAAAHRACAKTAEELGWLRQADSSLLAAGLLAHQIPDFPAMIVDWTRRVELQRRRGQPHDMAHALLNLGSVHGEVGDYPTCVQFYRQALLLLEDAPEPDLTAYLLQNLGLAYTRLGDHRLAQVSLLRGLDLAAADGMEGRRAELLFNLAAASRELGEHAAAIEALEKARAHFASLDEPRFLLRCLGALGAVHLDRHDYEAAAELSRELLPLARESGSASLLAGALTNAGLAEAGLGHGEPAEAQHREALEAAREAGDPWLEGQVLLNLAQALAFQGKSAPAREAWSAGAAIAERLASAGLAIEASAGLAAGALASGAPREALEHARKAALQIERLTGGLAEGQGAEARTVHARLYALGLQAARALEDRGAVWEFLERGRARALLESLEGRASLRETALPPALRQREEEARRAEGASFAVYQRALAAGARAAIQAARRDYEKARAALDAAVRRIQLESRAGADLIYPSTPTLQAFQASLSPEEAFVVYALAASEALAFAVTRDASRVVPLGPTRVLEEACASFDGGARNAESLARLAALLLEPAAFPKSIRRLLVAPDGALFSVPFPALAPDREVACVPSASTYLHLKARARTNAEGVLALGDPDIAGRPDLTPLPASAAEARAVGTQLLLGKDASEPRLREALAERPRWRAVHLACHARIDPDFPMRSSLALAAAPPDDGLLETSEIFRLAAPADLVALSACESGRGRFLRGEGLVGFTRAFLFAGGDRVLVSLWKVDDDATRALMTAFCGKWKKGAGAAAALRAAQASVREEPKWSAPVYWAAWQIWGLPE